MTISYSDAHKPDREPPEPATSPPAQAFLGAIAAAACLLFGASSCAQPQPDPSVSADQASAALRQAADFYRGKVSTEGGYHFRYSEDLSYGRSESAEGLSQVTVQRAGTPRVGMAYLSAYEATGDRFYLDAARDAAHALVKGQLCSGGWDYIIEFDPEKRKLYPYRAEGNCGQDQPDGAGVRRAATTLDDNVTQAALRLLMRVDRELDFKDEKIHKTALFALDSLIKAQYPNGAWPQRFRGPPDPAEFPVKPASYPESWSRTWPGPDYRGHYTFNDNSNSDMIDAMLEASRIYDDPRYKAVAEKGAHFILLAQMPDPQPGWAQQYDRDMHPAWARIFEPPSVTGGESQGVLKTLLLLYRETGDKKYIEPIPRALDYYRKSELPEVENPSAYRARACPAGSVCMARFYELKTNRPLYITKGTRARVRGESTNLLSGYGVSYSDESVIRHYGVLTRGDEFAAIAREYERVSHADSSTLRRPDRLKGLSPWDVDLPSEPEPSLEDLARRASQAINTLDERGAWVEEGSVGKAERIVQLFAAEDMVVAVGDRTLSLPENETLEVFPGAKPPLEQIINSTTFANNVEALADYLASTAQ